METFKVVLTFKSTLAVLSRGTIYIKVFDTMKFRICLEFSFWALLGVKGLQRKIDTESPMTGVCSDREFRLSFLRLPLACVQTSPISFSDQFTNYIPSGGGR